MQDDVGPLAQLAEQRTFNPRVVGSSPTGPTLLSLVRATSDGLIRDRASRVTSIVARSASFSAMATSSKRRSRQRGAIDELPSGALRVRVYAGMDPISKKRIYLSEVVPAGPRAGQEAERVRSRLQNQVDERRNPRTRATVDQLLHKWLQVLDVGPSTRRTYEGYIRKHIRPTLGSLPLTRLDVEILDSFYAEL